MLAGCFLSYIIHSLRYLVKQKFVYRATFFLTAVDLCAIIFPKGGVPDMNERIRELIKALNMKQAEFAKRIGVSRPFVSELCSGNKKPSDRTVVSLA